MKKIVLVLIAALLLGACGGSKEQLGLKEVLTAKLKDDPDLKDYKLSPEEVADCVVSQITDSLPGFSGDPRRTQYFEAYAKFVAVRSPDDAEKAMEQYKDLFGSLKQAREAAVSVTDHIMSCMGAALEKMDPESSAE